MTTDNQPTTPPAADPAAAAATQTPAPAAADPAKPADPAAAQPADDKAKDPAQLLFGNKDGDDKDPADPEKKDGEGDKKDGDDKPAEGVKFEDFKIDPEMVVPDEVKTELLGIVNNKELDEKGKTQALIDLHQKMMKQQAEGFQGYRKILREASEKDPVIGGDKLQESIKAANNAVFKLAKDPKFGGSDDTYNGFVERLTILGLGDDPYVIRFLTNVNKLVERTKDDTLDGGNSGGQDTKTVEQILWRDMK